MKNNNKTQSSMTFKEAVEKTPEISTGYQFGLKALGKYSNKVFVKSTPHLEGSVDIDLCTSKIYPHDNRWDYALSYKGEVFFVEVHSAQSSEVQVILSKLKWLKDWLHSKAPEINNLKAKSRNPFIWVQTSNFQIPPNTPQYRAAVQNGLRPIKKLVLD